MTKMLTPKLLYKAFALAGLSLCLWAVTPRSAGQRSDTFIPVVVREQLPPKEGVVPVYLVCGQARLGSPNKIEEFRCTFKNATNLNITAVNIIYSITYDQNGVSATDTINHTVETLVHPDFRATSKLIGPGGESSVGPPGPTSYSNNAVVRGIEASIDYIQFENGTTVGPDTAGSHIINAMRSGAEKYKIWLKSQYNSHGRSVAALSADIQESEAVPTELQTDSNQELGAKEYRRQFQKLLQTEGAASVKKLLESN
jgi:hypothetical protein